MILATVTDVIRDGTKQERSEKSRDNHCGGVVHADTFRL